MYTISSLLDSLYFRPLILTFLSFNTLKCTNVYSLASSLIRTSKIAKKSGTKTEQFAPSVLSEYSKKF